MTFQTEQIVKATVTKSRPGEDVGLGLEECEHKRSTSRRVYINDIGGLFKQKRIPVNVGDRLLEVNGISVRNKNKFPNGTRDIEGLFRREWNIWVKVKTERDPNTPETSEVSSDSEELLLDEEPSGEFTGDSSIEDSDDQIEVDDDSKHHNTNNSNKRRVKRQPRKSPFSAFVNEKSRGRRRRKNDSKHLERVDSCSNNTATTSDETTPPSSISRSCQNGRLLDFHEADAGAISPLAAERACLQQRDVTIRDIQGTRGGITLQMSDGSRVSLKPDELLEMVSEQQKSKHSHDDLGGEPDDDEPPCWNISVSKRNKIQEILAEEGYAAATTIPPPEKPPSRRATLTHVNASHKKRSKSKDKKQRRSSMGHSSSHSNLDAKKRSKSKDKKQRRSSMGHSSSHSALDDNKKRSKSKEGKQRSSMGHSSSHSALDDKKRAKERKRRSSMGHSSSHSALDDNKKRSKSKEGKRNPGISHSCHTIDDKRRTRSKERKRRSSMGHSSSHSALDDKKRSKSKEGKRNPGISHSCHTIDDKRRTRSKERTKSKERKRRASMDARLKLPAGLDAPRTKLEEIQERSESTHDTLLLKTRQPKRSLSVPYGEVEALNLDMDHAMNLPDLRSLMNKKPEKSNLDDVLKRSWLRLSLKNMVTEKSKAVDDSMRNVLLRQTECHNADHLTSLLEERSKKVNPEMWEEESNTLRSTISCFTNLIEPGDLMKIRGFTAKPKMNGSTVEVVRPSRGTGGKRWDVRVVNVKRKSIVDIDSSLNSLGVGKSKKLVSVAAENLRHFM